MVFVPNMQKPSLAKNLKILSWLIFLQKGYYAIS